MIDGTEILDARISIDQDGTPFICQNLMKGATANDKLGYKYSWILANDFTQCDVTNLKLVETKSWDTLALKGIKDSGYTIENFTEEVAEELTVEEICKLLGRTVKIKK